MKDKKKSGLFEKLFSPKMYSEEEMHTVEDYISDNFGKFDTVMHEIFSPDIHIDVCEIKPTKDNKCLRFVTMGMGAHKMSVPDELKNDGVDRAELVITLPADWDIKKMYWPVKLLKILARMPINEDTWLGWGHTIDIPQDFFNNAEFAGVVLYNTPYEKHGECILPDGSRVNFYQVIPIYSNEMDLKINEGAQELLDRLIRNTYATIETVDVNRKSAADEPADLMDNVVWHSEKILKLNLDLENVCGATNMAFYLRWCIEHDLLSDETKQKLSDADTKSLREDFIRKLGGRLYRSMFNENGAAFAKFYYDFLNEDFCYPADIDAAALEYFGEKKYNSPEYHDEAYLFVPYDDEYYALISKYIDKAYEAFRNRGSV